MLDITHTELVRETPVLADIVHIQFHGQIDDVASIILKKLNMENPYTQIDGKQTINIIDRNGTRATWTLQRTLRVNKEPLKTMEVRISSDGKIVPISVNPGRLKGIRQDGGVNVLVVEYLDPLPVGQVFTQSVVFDAHDMFRFHTAQGRIVPSLPYQTYEISAELPEPNLPTEIHAFKQVGKTKTPLPGLRVNSDKTKFAVKIDNLEPGILYALEWIWDVEHPRDEALT